MTFAKKITIPFSRFYHNLLKIRHYNFQVRKAKRNYRNLPKDEKKKLTPEQKKEIRQFYKRLTGERVSTIWHQYFYSRTGVYAKEYLPTSLYRVELMDRANIDSYRDAYVDKNMLDTYLPNVKHPHAFLKNMNGYFYMDGEAVSRDTAIQRLQNLDGALIKPTLESHGVGVRKLTVKDGITNLEGRTIDKVLDDYGKNYSIQEFLQQHDALAALNPSSVNTIRILTYRSDMEVIVLYSVIRIGRAGREIDNESTGGISTKINPDGTLGKYAFGAAKEGRIERTDSGIVLDGYKIPYYEVAVEMVKKCHLQLPFFNLIGWDVSIDKDGIPVIIEWNIHTELSQSAFGPAFGQYTERIIRELWSRPNTRDQYL